MRKKKKPYNPILSAAMIFITFIIPAVCLGWFGVIALIYVCIYFYDRDMPKIDPQYHELYLKDLEETKHVDENSKYLKYFFQDGQVVDWVNFAKYVNSRENKVFHRNIGLVSSMPAHTFIGETRTRYERIQDPKERRMIARVENKKDWYRPRLNQWNEFCRRIEDEFDFKKVDPILKEEIFVFNVGYENTTAKFNCARLFYYGVSAMKNETDVPDHVLKAIKERMNHQEGLKSLDDIKKEKFDQDMYDRFLKSWNNQTLPPCYTVNFTGALQAYLDWVIGTLKVKQNGRFTIGLPIRYNHCYEDYIHDERERVFNYNAHSYYFVDALDQYYLEELE